MRLWKGISMAERLWMKIDTGMVHSVKVAGTAEHLGITRTALIGHLYALWAWAANFAEDGHVGDYKPADLARAAEWGGDVDNFIRALYDYSWVDSCGTFHEWQEWGGAGVQARAKARERTRLSRLRNSDGNASVTAKTKTETKTETETESYKSKDAAKAAKENPNQPTHDQIYLAERLTEEWNQPLSPAALVKLNKKHGVAAVTSALRELRAFPPADAIRKLYAYVDTMAGMEDRA
jgi:hypothetical protein